MSNLDEAFKDAMAANIGGGMLPGSEPVTYRSFGGAPRAINAQVWRQAPAEVPGVSQFAVVDLTIAVARHATLGVTSVNVQGDTVTLAVRRGEDPQVLRVTQLLSEDAGTFRLKLG